MTATKRDLTDSPAKLFGLSFLILAVVVAGMLAYRHASVDAYAVEQAHFLGPGRVLLVHRPAAAFGNEHLAELLVVDITNGEVMSRVEDSGERAYPLRVVGPMAGRLWFVSLREIWSRPLSTPSTMERADARFAAHPELGGGFDLKYLSREGPIVRGRASNEYLVRPSGEVEESDWIRNTHLLASRRFNPDDDDPLRHAVHSTSLAGTELSADATPLERGFIVVDADDQPLLTRDPVGVLAVGGDIAVQRGLPQVDRVALVTGPKRVAWTVSTRELFGETSRIPLKLATPGIRVLAAQLTDQGIELVLRARSSKGETETHFVMLEPSSGRVKHSAVLGGGG